ncbi:RHOMBOID-like protein 9, chloroplastic isoform X1 [Pyrus communis]|uniref:RHOMBOID-like protein 9, chloroplastic isoform X1 n=1 Tax=Pyrus communis TaxID=23211 RepID=UPI0035C1B284
MAVVPISYKMPYKDYAQSNHHVIGQRDSKFRCDYIPTSANTAREHKNLGMVWYAAPDSGANGEHLRSLDSYFGKLQNVTNLPLDNSNKTREQPLGKNSGQLRLKKGLESLDDFLGKLNRKGGDSANSTSSYVDLTTEEIPIAKPTAINRDSGKGDKRVLKTYRNPISKREDLGRKNSQDPLEYNEISDLYLIQVKSGSSSGIRTFCFFVLCVGCRSILGSVNIAVFLFEIASPVRNTDLGLFSLPLLYGAKINDLILVGEWWRLVTPVFLHSGLFHIAVGCWGLVAFGPKVCRGYGSFTFFLIYILGGVSGNLISFLHTPEPTVGGTGPIFSMIGAWLAYQVQNKAIIAKDVSESMFQKAVITTLLSFVLSIFGPIDDWTHFGAAFTGVAYGFLTCPTLQLDDASSSPTSGQEEGIALVRRSADPCKSLFFFALFVLVLSSILFFVDPPLHVIASDTSL